MVAPTERSVVLIPFPFSDLSQSKLRPAVSLANASMGDFILCQITSNPYRDSKAVRIDDSSFESGSLRITSYARPGKLFTANQELIVGHVGNLKTEVFETIIEAIISILRSSK